MANVLLISDHHFGHANVLTFMHTDVDKLRPGFSDVTEMDEHMVKCHNDVVKPNDKVYFLGDVCMSHKSLPILGRLNGKKCLIKGNHDKAKLSQYLPYFYDIRGSHQFDGMLLTHIPTHVESLGRWPVNVHGHTHANYVKNKYGLRDPRYVCVCVEQPHINYTPISLEELKLHIKNQPCNAHNYD